MKIGRFHRMVAVATVATAVGVLSFAPSASANSEADTSPFYGGSTIGPGLPPAVGDCTSAFPWYQVTTSTYGMLTAGHCYQQAGNQVSTPAQFMGYVRLSSWGSSKGSVDVNGAKHGDFGLIDITAPNKAAAMVYRRLESGTVPYAVQSTWSQSATVGDQYCTDGRVTGELCGWVVRKVPDTVDLGNGITTFPTVYGEKTSGKCTLPGDSGAPVYTVLANGNVVAKGIHNAGSAPDTNGNYQTEASWLKPCIESFTDIHDVMDAVPGGHPLTLDNPAPPPPPPTPAPIAVRRNDYNRDGISDILAVSNDCLHEWSGTGQGGAVDMGTIGCGWTPYATTLTAVGDVNRDGNGDLVAVYNDCLYRWFGNGSGGFITGGTYGCGWGIYAASLAGPGDVNGDGVGDLVAIYNNCLYEWYGTGTGGFSFNTVVGCGWSPFAGNLVAAGDIDHDGLGDLVAVSNNYLYRWVATGGGGFTGIGTYGDGWDAYAPTLVGMSNFSNSAGPDLVSVRADCLHRWYGDGLGGWSYANTSGCGWSPYFYMV